MIYFKVIELNAAEERADVAAEKAEAAQAKVLEVISYLAIGFTTWKQDVEMRKSEVSVKHVTIGYQCKNLHKPSFAISSYSSINFGAPFGSRLLYNSLGPVGLDPPLLMHS